MLTTVRGVLAAALIALATAGSALAAPIFNSGSFGYGLPNSTTSDVTTTTLVNNFGFAFVLSVDGDFTGHLAPGNMLLVPNPTNFANPASFTWPLTTGVGSFTASSVVSGGSMVSGSGSSQHATATWYVYGLFTVGSDYANAGTVLGATKTISLTQTGGPGHAISYSSTFYVPPQPPDHNVPEPASLFLIGAGLALTSLRNRAKAKRAA